ncbi:MAG: diadenylate cyclase CdaA [Clostridia bacterium]|nr:diadenylate cyclase CdaA [Clostridia bacterium]MBQ5545420.1 diadenylate cyclase CdaA [Clostridia bacterium]
MLNDFLEIVQRLVTYFTIFDLIDILIVSFLVYYLIVFIRDTRAQQLMKGIVVIVVAYMLATSLQLNTLRYIIEVIINNGILAVIIIFQPELRSFLEHMGRSKFSVTNLFGPLPEDSHEAQLNAINGVVEAFRILQKQKMGALVVFEREDLLNDIAATGTQVDAVPNAGVIGNIFFNKAPLHDGAVIIRDGRVHSAGCILPLTHSSDISMELGTRHRAAIGMSENSDAVVVVLSEETGQLSIAIAGTLQRFDTVTEFTSVLMQVLLPNTEETVSKRERFWQDVKGRFARSDSHKKQDKDKRKQ